MKNYNSASMGIKANPCSINTTFVIAKEALMLQDASMHKQVMAGTLVCTDSLLIEGTHSLIG